MTDMWYHARKIPIVGFSDDTPAFFTDNNDDLTLWAGTDGYVVTAELAVSRPVGEAELHRIALELGCDDCFDPDFADFPDVSSYLYDARVRRRLEELGYDGYRGEDGYLWVTVVWNPAAIRITSHETYAPPAKMIAGQSR